MEDQLVFQIPESLDPRFKDKENQNGADHEVDLALTPDVNSDEISIESIEYAEYGDRNDETTPTTNRPDSYVGRTAVNYSGEPAAAEATSYVGKPALAGQENTTSGIEFDEAYIALVCEYIETVTSYIDNERVRALGGKGRN